MWLSQNKTWKRCMYMSLKSEIFFYNDLFTKNTKLCKNITKYYENTVLPLEKSFTSRFEDVSEVKISGIPSKINKWPINISLTIYVAFAHPI